MLKRSATTHFVLSLSLSLSLFSLLAFSLDAPAQAQQPVTTTGGGNAGYVPMFTSGANVENSAITQSGGSVGIGTTSPVAPITVGNYASSSTHPVILSQSWDNAAGFANFVGSWDSPGWWGIGALDNGSDYTLFIGSIDTPNQATGTWSPNQHLNLAIPGKVGIGTTNPGAALEVNGGIKLSSGSNGAITFQDGTTQTTAFNPALSGADYAESVGVSGDSARYGPGDLLVIDPNTPGKFLKSNEAYSTMVAGVYSTKPGFVGRLHPASDPDSAGEVPMAMVGRVPAKVSAENGPSKREIYWSLPQRRGTP